MGANRVKNAHRAIDENQAEIIILDDGFQHFRLHRHCDVVTINATNAFGNGYLIPRGNLREPVENLKRAHLFVLTNAALGKNNINIIRQRLKEINPRAAVFEADHEPVRFIDFNNNEVVELGVINHKKTAILSGIEDPVSFEKTLERLGANIIYAARFNDHHVFTRHEIKEVFKTYLELGTDFLVTTWKDYYRLGRIMNQVENQGIRIIVLQIEMRMDDEELFVQKCVNL